MDGSRAEWQRGRMQLCQPDPGPELASGSPCSSNQTGGCVRLLAAARHPFKQSSFKVTQKSVCLGVSTNPTSASQEHALIL